MVVWVGEMTVIALLMLSGDEQSTYHTLSLAAEHRIVLLRIRGESRARTYVRSSTEVAVWMTRSPVRSLQLVLRCEMCSGCGID